MSVKPEREARKVLQQSSVRRKLRTINRLLENCYRTPDLGNKDDPLEELIFICLAQRTHEAGFMRSYDSLRSRFPTWEQLARARERTIAKVINAGGLAALKAKRIKRILRLIHNEVGEYSLSFLYRSSDDEAFDFLNNVLGTGRKTAYCVMMYSLNRHVFPIDTNCLRVLQRFEMLPVGIRSEKAHKIFNGHVPPNICYSLHVNMVAHGRKVCARLPKCTMCVLARICPYPKRLD